MDKFQTIINEIVAELTKLGGEAAQLGEAIMTFIGITGPAGFTVATDVLTDVATKAVTPTQAVAQFQDVVALGNAVGAAVTTIKAATPPPAEPVPAEPPPAE